MIFVIKRMHSKFTHNSSFYLFSGDWFILMQCARRINPAVFHDVILDLRDQMDQKRADNTD